MHQEGYVVALLSGELDVTQRATILKRFRDGKERVLVTTNVCARGIDVEQVTLVVNFDLPMTKVSFSTSKLKKRFYEGLTVLYPLECLTRATHVQCPQDVDVLVVLDL